MSTNAQKQSRASLIAFMLVMFALVGVGSAMIAPYFLAIVMGGILAILSQPPYRWLLNKNFKPRLAASIVTLGLLVLVIGPFLGFAAMAIRQGITVGQHVAQSNISVQDILTRVSEWAPMHYFVNDAAELEQVLKNSVHAIGENASTFVLAIAGGVPAAVLQFVLAAMACFFFLIDGRDAVQWITSKVPIDLEIRSRLQGSFKDTAISVVWASMAAAAAQALVMMAGFLALSVPAAFFAAGATFILAWIPLFGTAPVWIAAAIYLFVNGSMTKVVIMVIVGFLTGIVDNFVRPWVLKGRGEMHPLVSLVAIFGGIQMFGIVGVFFGPILAAVVITVLQVWPTVGRKFGLQFAGSIDTPEGPTPSSTGIVTLPGSMDS